VGSNDLMQFFYASDRGNPRISNRYDILSPPSLSMLRFIVEKCDKYDVPLTLCGEVGGKTIGALALLAIGYRRLSIAPAAVGPVKMMIRSLNLKRVEHFVEQLLSRSDQRIRDELKRFCQENNVKI